jgi:putative endonuclease
MAEHNELGKLGRISCIPFAENGYTIMDDTNWTFQSRNWYHCQKRKYPHCWSKPPSLEFGLPQDFVKPKKIQLLVKAWRLCQWKDLDIDVRFDIIAIHKEGNLLLNTLSMRFIIF